MDGQKHTADELREKLGTTGGIEKITALFDEGTFTELSAYLKRRPGEFETESKLPEAVRGGFGAVNGKLVFAFSEDSERTNGAFTSASAGKISSIIKKAISQRAPLVGFFDSNGVAIKEGPAALSGMAEVLDDLALAQGLIPTIAIISGNVTGINAAIAASFDYVIKEKDSFYAVTPASVQGDGKKESFADFYADTPEEAVSTASELISLIPADGEENVSAGGYDLNADVSDITVKTNGYIDPKKYAKEISDGKKYLEFRSDDGDIFCAFITLNSRTTAVVASGTPEKRKISCKGLKKAADFLFRISEFDIPVLFLVSSEGFDNISCKNFASHAALFARAKANITSPSVSLITGNAFGASFALFGARKLSTDVVYALPGAVISALSPEATVEFLSEDELDEGKKKELMKAWENRASSPVFAAECGEIDDIVDLSDSRRRISAAFEMLS